MSDIDTVIGVLWDWTTYEWLGRFGGCEYCGASGGLTSLTHKSDCVLVLGRELAQKLELLKCGGKS